MDPSAAAMEASTPSIYFWRLFSLYIHNLVAATSSSAEFASSIVEPHILPLLHRFGFISRCRDVPSLRSILLTLRDSGFELPLRTTRFFLSSDLILHSLLPSDLSPDLEDVENKMMSSELLAVRSAFEFAKESLEHSFHLLRNAMDEAMKKLFACNIRCNTHEMDQNSCLQAKICVLEEEICWNICDEKHLLEYILEGANNHMDSNGQDNAEESRLSCFIRRGLQSPTKEARLQALKLAVACSFHSHYVFSKLFHLFETSLYLEDFSFREYMLSALMDMIYMHHDKITFGNVSHLIFPFLYAPTVNLQLAAIIGCGRLLLFNCFPEEVECLLSAMLDRFVYESISISDSIQPKSCTTIKNPKHNTVLTVMSGFFYEYSGENGGQHQDEIANTMVYMCLERIDEGVVLIVESDIEHKERYHHQQCLSQADDQRPDSFSSLRKNAILHDNPERAHEARSLHLAIQLGLSMSHTIDAVLDSLVLNINEQRQLSNNSNLILVSRDACQNWILGSKNKIWLPR